MQGLPARDEVLRATGAGVRVLLLDSGVAFGHEAFAGLKGPLSFRVEGERVVPASAAEDRLGHGTAVASLVHGHAPGAALHAVQIFGIGSEGLQTRTRNALLGLRWGIEQGYDVINCSFVTEESTMLADFKELVDAAFRRGTLVVASSDGEEPGQPRFPADFPSVLSTTHGPLEGLSLQRLRGALVEFRARGELVRVAWSDGGYRIATGSSYAAAHVTALAARLRQLRPGWNACEVKAALYAIAQPTSDGAQRA